MIDAQRSSQRWIFWLLLIIAAIYLALTLNWVLNNQQQRHKLQTTLHALPLLLPVQQLTQQLQTERGMLAGFSTQQLPSRPPIELQQLQTDAAWRDLELILADHQTISETAQDYLTTLPKKTQLLLLRQQISDQQLNNSEVKRGYSELLRPLLDLADYLQQKNELTGLTTPLAAIVALTEALERAGQERATLHVAFAEQQMSASRYQSYVILVNEQMDYLQQFAALSSPVLQQQWRQVQSQFENGSFIELREQALAQDFDGDATLWFTLASTRMDKIYQLRFELCQQLLQQAHQMDQQLEQVFQQLLVQLQWLLLIFLLLIWRIYRLHYAVRPLLKQIRHSPQF
ncbi:nitrate- and nitrite sensing domain-containing protein [Rheinheimera riviphila]|nr:nitrate- and nitrite sensing domain-containing protein [Rheinheimera riviphila]